METVVSLSEGTVTWKVNGVQQATITKGYLRDATKTYVPYVEMYYNGDSIVWVGSEYQ